MRSRAGCGPPASLGTSCRCVDASRCGAGLAAPSSPTRAPGSSRPTLPTLLRAGSFQRYMNDTARQAPAPAFPSPSIRARALLVADDEPQIRLAVRTTLQEMTDRVLDAATGAEAIKVAAAEEPDLVILDLGLPDVPGIDVCRAIRRWATMPIVVLS